MNTFPKQQLAISTPAKHTLYCGSRKAGKTYAQLMCYMRMAVEHWHQPIRGIVLDRLYPNLDDIIAKSKLIIPIYDPHAKYIKNQWTLSNGSVLLFRHAPDLDTIEKYLGHSYQFIGFNELTKWKDEELYDRMCATLESLQGLQARAFSTTNPFGRGKKWIKKRFIGVPYGELQTRDSGTHVAIFGSFTENKMLPKEAIADVLASCKNNPELAKAWIDGSWDNVVGGAFDFLWDRKKHVIPQFKIPVDWRIDRSMDWGSSAPCSILWCCEVRSEERVLADREIKLGTIIVFHEWYVSDGRGKGLRYSPRQIAEGILSREHSLRNRGIIHRDAKIYRGAADSQIFGSPRADIETIGMTFQKAGVTWLPADKSPGSRMIGKQLIRDRLADQTLLFVDTCKGIIERLPALENDEVNVEDIADGQEDHDYDALRYRIYRRRISKAVPGGMF